MKSFALSRTSLSEAHLDEIGRQSRAVNASKSIMSLEGLAKVLAVGEQACDLLQLGSVE
jgi:hypothetical protein